MIPRDVLRTIPDSTRYWSVSADRGEHHFRFPGWAVAEMLWTVRLDLPEVAWVEVEGGRIPSARWLRQASPWLAAIVGGCWWHRGFDLATPAPGWRDEIGAWLDYGASVCDELMEDGYTLPDVLALYNGCQMAINERLGVLPAAAERADFSEPAEGSGPEETETPLPDSSTPDASTSSPRKSA